MPNTIVFANKQAIAAASVLQKHKQKIALVALQKQKQKQNQKQKRDQAAAIALQKQKQKQKQKRDQAAIALQKLNMTVPNYIRPNSGQIIFSTPSDYISVPGIVFNQNTVSDLNKINISVSSVYVPAI